MRNLLLVLIMLKACAPASAVPVPNLDFERLIAESDLVCVGSTESLVDQGQDRMSVGGAAMTLERMMAMVRCHRVLKGNLGSGAIVNVEFVGSSERFLPFVSLSAGETTMLFLKAGSNSGTYTFADPYHGKQPASRGLISYSPSASIRQKVEAELVGAVREATPPANALQALDRLKQMNSELFLPQADTLAASASDPQVRNSIVGTAVALRIEAGDIEALRLIQTLPMNATDNEAYQPWQDALLSAIEQLRAPKAVPILNQLLGSGNPGLRASAARALDQVANDTSVPFLKQCLSDNNSNTAYDCLVALSKVTNKPGPGYNEFQRNRAKYVEVWQRE
jgi:HEAT repeats